MLVLGALTVVGLLVALLLGMLVYFVATWIGVPHPIAAIIAVLVFLAVLFGAVGAEGARYWGALVCHWGVWI